MLSLYCCSRPDLRDFGGARCCLSCGEEATTAEEQQSSSSTSDRVLQGKGDDEDFEDGHRQSVELWDGRDDFPSGTDIFLPSEFNMFTRKEGSYAYTPIQMDKKEMRLLMLEPGAPGDPLNCRIVHTLLGSWDQPEYEAVSYTWADENGTYDYSQTVRCGEQNIPVTKNGESALKRLRLSGETRLVWMDQLCIDQSNISERGHQVGLVPRIYASAKKVLIYLGEHTDFAKEVFAAAKYLNLGPRAEGFPTDRYSRRADTLQDLTRRILRLPWFTRVWVLQEVAAARKAVVLSSNSSVDWECFRSFVDSRFVKKPACSETVPGALSLTTRHSISVSELLTLLASANGCRAGDPRDKVFALLGIVISADERGLFADYTKTPEQVFMDTALYLIRESRTLDVLSYCGPWRSDLSKLPSWAPNWADRCRSPLNDEVDGFLQTAGVASKARRPELLFGDRCLSTLGLEEGGGLIVHGRLIARVTKENGNPYSLDYRFPIHELDRIFSWAGSGGKELFLSDWSPGFSNEKIQVGDEVWQLDGTDALFALRDFRDGFVRISECFLAGFYYQLDHFMAWNMQKVEEITIY